MPSTEEVMRFVEALSASGSEEMVAFEDGTALFEWGWRVVMQPRRWVETRAMEHQLIGLGPTYVTRAGRVFTTGSGKPPEFYEDGLAWELSGKKGIGGRLRMWWRGWSAAEYLCEQRRAHILEVLRGNDWALDFYRRWTEGQN